MINRISIVMLWLTFVLVFVVTGCEQRQKEETPAHITLIGPNFVVPDYVLQAIEATGGYTAWENTEQIEFDAVVTFYQPDGSFELTQQHYSRRRPIATEQFSRRDTEYSNGSGSFFG